MAGLSAAAMVNLPDEGKTAKVKWNETTHDFGKVVQNIPATATFEFTNNGESPVVITAAKASCGCTVPRYTKEPVKPGETATVTVTYNSRKVGNFSKSVRVSFDGSQNVQVLIVKGNVEPVTEKEVQ